MSPLCANREAPENQLSGRQSMLAVTTTGAEGSHAVATAVVTEITSSSRFSFFILK
jgi:hypothetical protein